METDALFCGFGFGLRVVEVTAAELAMAVPSEVAHVTISVTVNWAEAPFDNVDAVQPICPEPPAAGVLQLQPAGATID